VALDLRHMPSIQGILVTHRDITERRMLERQLDQARRLESVGQLAAGVAHEINTPVQFLANNLAFLQQVFMALSSDDTSSEDLEFFRSEAPEAIQQSLDGVDHIAQITKAMKAFADPERSTAQICNMQKLIDNTVIVAGQELRTAAELTIIAGDQTEVRCVGNEISQALLSLLTNAAHAIADAGLSTEQGRITIATQQVGNFLRLSVEDNGIGIDDNIKDRLFEPFFTTKEVGRGAGQGLNQVYATVARHGGQVGFDSTPGSGSVFWFDLPLDSSQADARETLSV
jgi:signal transduction histidine kinase